MVSFRQSFALLPCKTRARILQPFYTSLSTLFSTSANSHHVTFNVSIFQTYVAIVDFYLFNLQKKVPRRTSNLLSSPEYFINSRQKFQNFSHATVEHCPRPHFRKKSTERTPAGQVRTGKFQQSGLATLVSSCRLSRTFQDRRTRRRFPCN